MRIFNIPFLGQVRLEFPDVTSEECAAAASVVHEEPSIPVPTEKTEAPEQPKSSAEVPLASQESAQPSVASQENLPLPETSPSAAEAPSVSQENVSPAPRVEESTSQKDEKAPEVSSVHKEVPAVLDPLRRNVEKKQPMDLSVQAEWEALVEFMDVPDADKSRLRCSLEDLWGALLPALSENAQRLLKNRLHAIHNQVSKELEGNDLSSQNFQEAFCRAQQGLERVTHSALEALAAICSKEK